MITKMHIQHCKYVIRVIGILCCTFILVSSAKTQSVFGFNILADVELSKAGEDSHYFFNEIDKDHTDWRLGLSQLNLLGKWSLGNSISFNSRLLIERDNGKGFDKFSVAQLSLQWISKKNKLGLTLGVITNPFGSFNHRQLALDRTFIALPLAYSYYVNVSPKIGFHPGLGETTKITINDQLQWGSSQLYYAGYTQGAMLSWNIKPSKVNLKLALVNGASNVSDRFTEPLNLGLITKLTLRPSYFWEQGFSLSHGSFMQNSNITQQLTDLDIYTQTLIGTHFSLGKGFMALSGEFIASFFSVPQYDLGQGNYLSETIENPLLLSNYSIYIDYKYEFPFFPGSYAAYRIDHLRFGGASNGVNNWNSNDVWRHTIAFGYNINQYILMRLSFSRQSGLGEELDKSFDAFRMVVTTHY